MWAPPVFSGFFLFVKVQDAVFVCDAVFAPPAVFRGEGGISFGVNELFTADAGLVMELFVAVFTDFHAVIVPLTAVVTEVFFTAVITTAPTIRGIIGIAFVFAVFAGVGLVKAVTTELSEAVFTEAPAIVTEGIVRTAIISVARAWFTAVLEGEVCGAEVTSVGSHSGMG